MNKIHHVRQHDSMECGISCLSIVCKIFDREYNTSELYKICKATKEGVSLKAITETAQTIGLASVSVRINGRTLSKNTQYGILKADGTIDIDEDLIAQRLAIATFENKECLNCKMLPVCMGPCSQKLLEHNGKWSKDICSLKSIDTSLSDYLITDFWVKSMIERYNE